MMGVQGGKEIGDFFLKNKFRNKLYGNLKCKQNKDWTCADISERKFLNSFKIMKKNGYANASGMPKKTGYESGGIENMGKTKEKAVFGAVKEKRDGRQIL